MQIEIDYEILGGTVVHGKTAIQEYIFCKNLFLQIVLFPLFIFCAIFYGVFLVFFGVVYICTITQNGDLFDTLSDLVDFKALCLRIIGYIFICIFYAIMFIISIAVSLPAYIAAIALSIILLLFYSPMLFVIPNPAKSAEPKKVGTVRTRIIKWTLIVLGVPSVALFLLWLIGFFVANYL
ncbi:MAG: hypothetical protein LBP26_05610 [Clostridiales bacterium]|nr:hypothetical protein [Clostridiales bacterium]